MRTVQGLETAEDPISDPSGSALGHQVVRPLWIDLAGEMMRRLDGLSLEDLCSRAYGAGIVGRTPEGGEFDIRNGADAGSLTRKHLEKSQMDSPRSHRPASAEFRGRDL